jgi:hypothetical protein
MPACGRTTGGQLEILSATGTLSSILASLTTSPVSGLTSSGQGVGVGVDVGVGLSVGEGVSVAVGVVEGEGVGVGGTGVLVGVWVASGASLMPQPAETSATRVNPAVIHTNVRNRPLCPMLSIPMHLRAVMTQRGAL